MTVIFIAFPVTLALAGFFLVAFVWSARGGQFDDMQTPAIRVLFDEDEERNEADGAR